MDPTTLELGTWVMLGLAAVCVGCSKVGLPGLGILAIPLVVGAVEGRSSSGLMLPLLIAGDCLAVWRHHKGLDWSVILRVAPWVLAGLIPGAFLLMALDGEAGKAFFRPVVGVVILIMLMITLLKNRFGDNLAPQGRIGIATTGVAAGAATTLANAAGPIMSLYLSGLRLSKEQFMGSGSVFFLCLNICKIPLYVAVAAIDQGSPLITSGSLIVNAAMLPGLIIGALLGSQLFTRISQSWFDRAVLLLAAIAAVVLLVR